MTWGTWRLVCSWKCCRKSFACWEAPSDVSRASPWGCSCILLAHDVANRACTHHRVSQSRDMRTSSRNLRWIFAALDILTRLAGEGKLKSLLDLKPVVIFTLVWKASLDLNSCLWIFPFSGQEPNPEDAHFHSQGEGSQMCLGTSDFSQEPVFPPELSATWKSFYYLGWQHVSISVIKKQKFWAET